MTQTSSENIKVRAINNIGIVVRDAEQVAQNYWNILGIGPWTILTFPPPHQYNRLCHGKPVYFVVKVAGAQVGSVGLELLETVEGHIIYDDFLMDHGEGANHLDYIVDSTDELKKHIDLMAKRGVANILSANFGNNGSYAYLDTVSMLGTIWEPVKYADEWSPPMKKYPLVGSESSHAKIRVKAIKRIGIAVKNIKETIENYSSLLGIGPWETINCQAPTLHEQTYYGRSTNYAMVASLACLGPLELELVQPIAGDSIFSDYICKHGEGINYLAFEVDDVDEATAIMENEGFPCIQYGKISSAGSYAYYNSIRETFCPARIGYILQARCQIKPAAQLDTVVCFNDRFIIYGICCLSPVGESTVCIAYTEYISVSCL